jgi:hypothetical protein
MTLNSSGQISLGGSTSGQSIALELGLSSTATITLNDTAVRNLAGVPSGAIVMPNDFWGKSSATYYFTVIYATSSGSVSTGAFSVNPDKSVNVYGRSSVSNSLLQIKLNSSGTATAYNEGVLTGGATKTFPGAQDSSNNIYFSKVPYIYKFNSTGSAVYAYSTDIEHLSYTIDNSGYIWASGYTTDITPALVKYNSSYAIQAVYAASSSLYTYTAPPRLARNYNSASGIVYAASGYVPCCCYWAPHVYNYSNSWTYPSSNCGEIPAVNTDSSGNVYFYDGQYLTKHNSSGIAQWKLTISGYLASSYAIGYFIEVDSSNNVYLVDEACSIIKVNSSGVMQWNRQLVNNSTGGNVLPYDVQINANDPSSIYISGFDDNTAAIRQGFIFKIPITGGLTQSFTLRGISYTYAVKSIGGTLGSGTNAYYGGYDALLGASTLNYTQSTSMSSSNAYSNAVNVL